MEDILFCKDLHDPLENKGDKPVATKDEEWRKMNRKMIGLIRQCIGHEALLLLSSLPESCETLVVSLSNSAPNGKLTTSMVMDALFNEEARKREMGSTNQSESQALVSEGNRKRGQGQGRGHHRDTGKGRWRSQARDIAATTVMAVDEDESDVLLAASDDEKSDWVLDSGNAYHFCKDREVFFTYAACEGRIWMANNTSSRVVGRGSVRFCIADRRSMTLTEVRYVPNLQKKLISIGMLDSKGCSFNTSGGTLRVSKKNKEILWGKKTRGLYRLDRSVQIGGATVRHGSSGISKKNGQGKQPLHRAQGDTLGYVQKSSQTRVVQLVQDVHREAQRKETKSILRSCTTKDAATPKQVSFALDLISGVLSTTESMPVAAARGGEGWGIWGMLGRRENLGLWVTWVVGLPVPGEGLRATVAGEWLTNRGGLRLVMV
ncbi:hypothetical protein Acr_00g0018110 [Actinidia rufa]|uniref:Retrovirus-related Pol polyprotein from transposon TNT 1-94-like beta-barrel domain-containing protein n=1 Tax=Actinidia rufa TaxID=165716 RepID=A0A7J0DBE0_9ERIC|nr:hypothetical protein Acr_00g0018110 [Actinidia rufa]